MIKPFGYDKAAQVLAQNLAHEIKEIPISVITRRKRSELYQNFMTMGLTLLDFVVSQLEAKNRLAGRAPQDAGLFNQTADKIINRTADLYPLTRGIFDPNLFLQRGYCFTYFKDEVILPILQEGVLLAARPPLQDASVVTPLPKPKTPSPFTVIKGGKSEPK
jgi:hypothetical protein